MRQFGPCTCDSDACARGDPFCGYCGRRVCSPAFCDSSGPLPLNLPYPTHGLPAEGQPFLELELAERPATPGIVGSLRLKKAEGSLNLSKVELYSGGKTWDAPWQQVPGQQAAVKVRIGLPRDFEKSGLQDLGVLRFHFTLRDGVRPFLYALPLQPARLLELRSSDARFEDQDPDAAARPTPSRRDSDRAAAAYPACTIWLFDDCDEPVAVEVAAGTYRDTLPSFARAFLVGPARGFSAENAVGRASLPVSEPVSPAGGDACPITHGPRTLTVHIEPAAMRAALAAGRAGPATAGGQDARATDAGAEAPQGGEGVVGLLLRSDDNGTWAAFLIKTRSRPKPRVELLKPAVVEIDFNEEKTGWLSRGSDKSHEILNYNDEVQHWPAQFRIGLRPEPTGGQDARGTEAGLTRLGQAAILTADLVPGNLSISARLKPDWLNANGDAPASIDGWAELVLLNTCNSRHDRRVNATGEDARATGDARATMAIEVGRVKISIAVKRRAPVPVLAIDFGTSNTCAALIPAHSQPAREVLILGEATVPTALFYGLKKNPAAGGQDARATDAVDLDATCFGQRACSAHRETPSSPVFKRGMKTELLDETRGQAVRRDKLITETLSLPARRIASDFLTLFLKECVDSPDVDGRRIENLVFTFPVAAPPEYIELLHAALLQAVQSLRLSVNAGHIAQSCDEATAGGIWWFGQKQEEFKNRQSVSLLVFDYGGGTTDLSVLEFSRREESWQVAIKGISGISPCGGEDLTWRMAREFILCACRHRLKPGPAAVPGLARASPPVGVAGRMPVPRTPAAACVEALRADSYLGRNLEQMAARTGRGEWQEARTRSLLEMIEDRKMDTVAKVRPSPPKAVLLDLLENRDSAFVPDALDFRGERQNLEDSCAPDGGVAVCRFNQFKQEGNEFVGATGESMLEGSAWLFQLRGSVVGPASLPAAADDGGLLREPARAVRVARSLLEHLYPDTDGKAGKVDYLLPIGQASRTKAAQEMIRTGLEGKFGEWAEEAKPKTCVALGACRFLLEKPDWDFRPTLLKRIVYLDRSSFKQLLRSDQERNVVFTLNDPHDPRLLRRPGTNLQVFVDWAYHGETGPDAERVPLNSEMKLLGQPGFDTLEKDKPILLVVADPSDKASYKALREAGGEEACKFVDSLDEQHHSGQWYFMAWPEGDFGRAWKFAYHV